VVYGVSVSFAQAPFNASLSYPDHRVNRQFCLTLQALYNCTTTGCKAQIAFLLTNNVVFSNLVPFIPLPTFTAYLSGVLDTNSTFNDTAIMLNNSRHLASLTPGFKGRTGIGNSGLDVVVAGGYARVDMSTVAFSVPEGLEALVVRRFLVIVLGILVAC
jgi:hypothetical protein